MKTFSLRELRELRKFTTSIVALAHQLGTDTSLTTDEALEVLEDISRDVGKARDVVESAHDAKA